MIVTPFAQVGVPIALSREHAGDPGGLLQLNTLLTTGSGQSQNGPQQRGHPCP